MKIKKLSNLTIRGQIRGVIPVSYTHLATALPILGSFSNACIILTLSD